MSSIFSSASWINVYLGPLPIFQLVFFFFFGINSFFIDEETGALSWVIFAMSYSQQNVNERFNFKHSELWIFLLTFWIIFLIRSVINICVKPRQKSHTQKIKMALRCKGRIMAMNALLTVSERKVGSVPPLPSVALGRALLPVRLVSYSVQWEQCLCVCVCECVCVCVYTGKL